MRPGGTARAAFTGGLVLLALGLSACTRAEDYLSSINPFRRAPPTSAPAPLEEPPLTPERPAGGSAPSAPVEAAPLPPPGQSAPAARQ